MRVLVVRNDRIGDLVLTTPVISTIRANYKDAFIAILVSKYAEDIVKYNQEVNSVISDESGSARRGIKNFLSLFKKIRQEKFDCAIILFPTFRICLLLLLAGIKRRISHGSKWFVFLFCNEILLQHRSGVEKHEADYNLELAKVLKDVKVLVKKTSVSVTSDSIARVKKLLVEKGISKDFIIIHCGSGGSARNWSPQNYARLADMIIDKLKIRTVFSGRGNDLTIINEVIKSMKNSSPDIFSPDNVQELIALISLARCFIGPSTGPLHIANALNIPVVGFYSPVKVQSKKRWGPYNNTGKTLVFSPDVECPRRFRCAYEKCEYYDCMELIKVEDVFAGITEIIRDV